MAQKVKILSNEQMNGNSCLHEQKINKLKKYKTSVN